MLCFKCYYEHPLYVFSHPQSYKKKSHHRIRYNLNDILYVFLPRPRKINPAAPSHDALRWRNHRRVAHPRTHHRRLQRDVSSLEVRQPIIRLLWNHDTLYTLQQQLRASQKEDGKTSRLIDLRVAQQNL